MPIPKRNPVSQVKDSDGRKNNGRKPGQEVSMTAAKLTPAKLNKAKKERIRLHALNGIIDQFGTEEDFWVAVAAQAKTSFRHLEFLAKYAFPNPSEIDVQGPARSMPTINFISTSPVQVQENTIDIDEEEDGETEE